MLPQQFATTRLYILLETEGPYETKGSCPSLVPEVSNLRPIYALNSGGRTQKVSRTTHMRMLKALALFLP